MLKRSKATKRGRKGSMSRRKPVTRAKPVLKQGAKIRGKTQEELECRQDFDNNIQTCQDRLRAAAGTARRFRKTDYTKYKRMGK